MHELIEAIGDLGDRGNRSLGALDGTDVGLHEVGGRTLRADRSLGARCRGFVSVITDKYVDSWRGKADRGGAAESLRPTGHEDAHGRSF
jgi:hypothetical protein